MNLPPCIIQSRRNGKFYNVDTESGDIDFENGMYMNKVNLELYYEAIDKNERFWIYKRLPEKKWSKRLSDYLNIHLWAQK